MIFSRQRSNSATTLLNQLDQGIPSNVTRQQEGFMTALWFTWRCVNFALILVNSIIISLGSFVYFKHRNETCHPQLSLWLLVFMCISAAQFISSLLMLILLPSIYNDPITAMLRAKRCVKYFIATRLITLFYGVWTLAGVWFLTFGSTSSNCPNGIDYIKLISALFIFLSCIILVTIGICCSFVPGSFGLYMAIDQGEDYIQQRTYDGAQSSLQVQNDTNDDLHLQSLLNHLNMISYKESEVKDEACIICLEEFSSNQFILVTTCQHLYHIQCLSKASKKTKQCPQCRQNLFK